MRRILLALALILAPAVAEAETCTVTASEQSWSSVTAGIAPDCTEGADDNFVVPTGATLTLTGAVTLTTGTITIEGGTLSVPCGYTLTYGARLHLRSGKLRVLGCERTEQRITGTAWAAASGTVTLPIPDVSTVATAGTDWLVFGDDDPTSLAATIGGVVQIGPGPPVTPGIYRPSYNKWAWYDINTATASTSDIVYYYDSLTGRGGSYTGVPYNGTRGAAVPTAVAITSLSADRYGFTTELTTTGAGAWIRADLGSQYVEFTSGTCTGQIAKILDVIDAGATETITIAGDATACGAANIEIHYGARSGDTVRVVRPAVLNGSDSGPIILAGGTFEIALARLTRLGYQGKGTAPFDGTTYATLARNCNICVIADSATVSPSAGSYIVDSEISYPTTASGDTSALGIISLNNGSSAFRYGSAPLAMAGVTFDRLHVHDGINNISGTGTHGIYVDGVGGLSVSRVRIERMSDDLYGENNTSLGNAATKSSVTLRQALLYEGIAGTNNSQECFQPEELNSGTGAAHEAVLGAGGKSYSDVIAVGCYGAALEAKSLGQRFERLIGGGISVSGVNILGQLAGFSNLPVGALADAPNTIKDVVVGLYTPSTSSSRATLHGAVDGAILLSNSGTASPPSIEVGPTTRRLFAMLPSTSYRLLNLTTGIGAHFGSAPMVLEDSVISSLSTGAYLSENYVTQGVTTWDLRRLFLALGSVYAAGTQEALGRRSWQDSAGACPGDTCPVTLTVEGLTMTSGTPSSYTIGAGAAGLNAATSTVDGACLATTAPVNGVKHFASLPTTDGFLTRDLRPLASEPTALRAFLAPENARGPCDDLKPQALGLQSLGVVHAMLGDLFLSQLANWSDRDLGKARSGGGGAIPRAF